MSLIRIFPFIFTAAGLTINTKHVDLNFLFQWIIFLSREERRMIKFNTFILLVFHLSFINLKHIATEEWFQEHEG